MRNHSFIVTLLMVMLFGLPMVQTESSASALRAECVKVTGQNVRLRYGPGQEYGIYCQLNKGTVLTYLGKSYDNNWYRVRYQGEELYISRDFASLCDCNGGGVNNGSQPRQKTKCVVHAKHLRLRTGPGTNYDYFIWVETGKPVYFNHGDVLDYLGVTVNGFYKVSYMGRICWISSDYCTLK